MKKQVLLPVHLQKPYLSPRNIAGGYSPKRKNLARWFADYFYQHDSRVLAAYMFTYSPN